MILVPNYRNSAIKANKGNRVTILCAQLYYRSHNRCESRKLYLMRQFILDYYK